jgi:hypothetical protein
VFRKYRIRNTHEIGLLERETSESLYIWCALETINLSLIFAMIQVSGRIWASRHPVR